MKNHNCDNVNCNHNNTKGLCCLFNPENCKYRQLQKENAELKEKKIKGCYFGKDELGNDFFAKCDCVDCQKRTIALLDLRKEYLNKINKEKTINEQFTKAKEIIRDFLSVAIDYIDKEDKNYSFIAEAEQFLNSEVEK